MDETVQAMNDIEANQALRAAVTSDHEIYGRLVEGLHIAGYTFERACSNLETMLDGDGWRLGGRFSDPNDFLDSLRLDKFRPIAEARKRIALRIKELQPSATNSAIGRTLGVNERTIRRDTSASAEPGPDIGNENNDAVSLNSANAELSGAAAQIVKPREIGGGAAHQAARDRRRRSASASRGR
jgi:hypothetical protein